MKSGGALPPHLAKWRGDCPLCPPMFSAPDKEVPFMEVTLVFQIEAGSVCVHVCACVLTWHKPNNLNPEKISTQQWLEPHAMCSLGMCHNGQTLTGMKFLSAFYCVCVSEWFGKQNNGVFFSVTLSHQRPARRQKPVESPELQITIWNWSAIP